ncbi:MAG: PIN domain-containing protein [Tepidisphaeraceae bacterium]
MSERAVYDAMVFLQWASLPAERQHDTIKALDEGAIRLCLSPKLVEEVRELLSRPGIRAKAPNLTDDRVAAVLAAAGKHADWFQRVPDVFSLEGHPDDDRLFNRAIEAKAKYLVTWENRILRLQEARSNEARRLRQLAPSLHILNPSAFATELRTERHRSEEQSRQPKQSGQ